MEYFDLNVTGNGCDKSIIWTLLAENLWGLRSLLTG